MRLDLFESSAFDRGRPFLVEALWFLVQAILVSSWIPGSWHRKTLLRLFGAAIGVGVVIKPLVRIKFPWRLAVGDHSWIGENVWIDNLARIDIGSHSCISQGAYICTGSHDWNSETFELISKPIKICDKAWICANAIVGPGVTVGEGAVLAMGSVATHDLEPWHICQGNPALQVRKRSRYEIGS